MLKKALITIFVHSICVVSFADNHSVSDGGDSIVIAKIQVTPKKIVLGRDTEAEIRIVLPKTFWDRAACKNVQVRVNTGEIDRVSRVSPGVFTAKYKLPGEFYPRFALISVSSYCKGKTVVGLTAQPLYGSGRVTVQSSAFAKVSLQIAEDLFGPVLTDETGRAEIPVVVPPGVFKGIAGDKVIDLNLPPIKRIVAFSVPPRVAADSEEGAALWIHTVDKTGRPPKKAELEVHPKRGRVTPVEAVAPGIFRARYFPPAKIEDGTDRVTISVSDEDTPEEHLDLLIYPGRPAQIVATIVPERHAADSTDPVTVFARVFDKRGNPVDARLTAVSDLGDLAAHPSLVSGEYRWTLKLPSHFRSKQKARIRIYSRTLPKIESSAWVELVPASPFFIEIKKPREPVMADGYTFVPIRMTVFDRFSNPTPARILQLSGNVGTLSPPVEDDAGGYTSFYTPPHTVPKETVRLRAEAGDVRADIELAVTGRFYRAAFTPSIGYFSNIGLVHAPIFSLTADLSLWMIARGLHAGSDISYYFSHAGDSSENVESVLFAFPVVWFVGYRFILSPRWSLDLSSGIGFWWARHILELQDSYVSKETAIQPAVSAAAGVAFRIGPGYFTFTIRYIYGSASKISSVSGNLGGLILSVGRRFLF